MPGTPATSPRFGAPRYSNSDTVDFAGQVNGVTDVLDTKAAKLVSRTVWTPSATLPTTPFPTSPQEGDEHLFGWPAQGGRPAGHWRFRWNQTTGIWEVTGGAPMLIRYVDGWTVGAAGAWVPAPTASGGNAAWGSFYVPWTGPFKVEWGFERPGTQSGGAALMGIQRQGIDGAAAVWTYSPGSGLSNRELYAAVGQDQQSPFLALSGPARGLDMILTSDGFGNAGPSDWTAGWRIRPLFQSGNTLDRFWGVFMSFMPLQYDPTP